MTYSRYIWTVSPFSGPNVAIRFFSPGWGGTISQSFGTLTLNPISTVSS